MRLPTLAGLTDGVRAVLVRFPEVMLAGVAAAVLASISIRDHGEGPPAAWAAAGLGISLFFCAAQLSERLRPDRIGRFDAWRLGLDAVALAALVALAFAWPRWSDSVRAHRLIQFALATHLLASFAPFVTHHHPNAFWQWNRELFVRFVIGGLFSAVLFGGLAGALAAAKPLFGLRVPEKAFFDLWLAVAFVFQTGYFLAGVPRDREALAATDDYPLVLKVFAQFVLVPLVALYLLILTVYLVKVLVTGQWPNGWIGWLVSSVSAAGLLTILLVHPVRDREENRWVATFSRWFFVALLPSVGMLFVAIGKRVGQYGFTEERYDLCALAAWVAAIAIGYSLQRRADIRWIPVTLCALAVFTSFGPWGAYAVSRMDQSRRLARTLERVGLPAVRGPGRELTFAESKQLSDGITYLVGAHGLRALPPALRAAAESDSAYRAWDARTRRNGTLAAQAVMRGLGADYVDRWQTESNRSFGYAWSGRSGAVETVAGFDRVVWVDGVLNGAMPLDDGSGALRFDARSGVLTLADSSGASWAFGLDSLARAHLGSRTPKPDAPAAGPLRLDAVHDGVPARLLVRQFGGALQADTLAALHLRGEIYVGRAR